MPIKNNKTLIGILLAIFSALMMSTVSLFAKLLSEHFGASEIVFLRNIFSLFVLGTWFIASGNFRTLKTKRPFAHIIRGIIGTAGIVIGTATLSIMPMAETTILISTAPLFVVLLSYPLLREPVQSPEIIAAIIGFIGIIVIARPTTGLDALPPLGIFLGLCWGLCAGLVNITLRWLGSTEDATKSVFYFYLSGLFLTGAHLPFAQMPESGFTIPMLWIIAGLGITSLVHQLAKSESFRLAKASIISPFYYSMIVWAILFDYLIWEKTPTVNILLGACIVVGSNLYILFNKSQKASHEKTD